MLEFWDTLFFQLLNHTPARGVIAYIIHYFTLMFQKCTLFTLFLIFVHYTLFLSNMYIILLIIHNFSIFFVKRVVQDPRRGQ